MASADLRKELECSVCLNVYTDPVTLKCGHNFCRDCIGRVLDTQEGSGVYSCPECRQPFRKRPVLQRNITLRNIVENFLSTHLDQEESGVFCTYCIHTPVPAVISCLHCEASLCDNHLRVHSKSPEHVLCDPTTSLENRKCSVHKKILEYYCTEDETCICMSCCLIGDHINHKKESLDEASEMKKKKLRNVLQKLMTEREEMEKRVQSLQEHGRKVQGEADDETERVTVLFRDLRRRLEDLEKRVLREISGQAERISGIINDLVQDLEIKKEELSRKLRHIEELCNVTDPLTVLQESDTGDLCDTEDGDDEDRERHDKLLHDGGDLDVGGISHTLHTGLSDIMSGVNVEKCPGTHVYPHSTTKGEGHINAEPSRKRLKPSPTIQPSRGPPQPSPTIQPSRGPPQPSPTIQPSGGPPQPSPTIQPSRGPPQPSPTIQPSRRPPQPSPTIQPSRGPPQPSPTIQPSRGPPQPSPTIQPSRTPPQPSPTIQPSRKRLKPSPIIQPSRGPPQPSPTIQPSRGPPQPSPTIQPSRGPPQPSPTIQPSRGPLQPSPTIQHSHLQAGGPNIGAVQQTSGVSGVTDILLDVRTAANKLHISDDRKTASWSLSHQNRPETPERFEDYYQVMSSQRFSSGRHYWEVDVGGSRHWRVGMCYPSIERRGGQSRIGYNKKSWSLEGRLFGIQLSVIHDSKETPLHRGVPSRRVGIDLDYEAGRISFYDLCDPIRHLHTFTTTFTEPLHAGVWVGGVGCIKICGGNQK
ncbi:E3 ubiquitin/ISG15 ligase TRIM25-like [Lithobates pipiens]